SGVSTEFIWTSSLRRRGFGGRRRLLKAVRPTKFLAEPLDPSGRVHEFLLSSEKWMTLATDIHQNLGHRAACLESVPAGAVGHAGLITRVNSALHDQAPNPPGR